MTWLGTMIRRIPRIKAENRDGGTGCNNEQWLPLFANKHTHTHTRTHTLTRGLGAKILAEGVQRPCCVSRQKEQTSELVSASTC